MNKPLPSLNKPLPRASSVSRADKLDRSRIIDRVVLDADEHHRRRVVLTGERDTQFLLDLPHATVLHDGDGLVLDDGSVILVAGKPEALVEIAAAGAQELARLAWHIGNRHTDVQVVGERLRAAVENLRIENEGCPQGVVTVSVGAASASISGEAAAARLVKEADRALYDAKCAGRNLVKLVTAFTPR